jgi:hypothetical protein
MGSIPVSKVVEILPNVVNGGGNPLALNGVLITQNDAVPNGTVLSFSSADSVGTYFGTSSAQAHIAGIYFAAFVAAIKNSNLAIDGESG